MNKAIRPVIKLCPALGAIIFLAVTCTSNLSTTIIEGPAEAPVSDHIPELPIPEPDPEDFVVIEDVFIISFREVLLVFEDGVTVGQANALLKDFNAVITGGSAEGNLLLIEVPANDLNQFMGILTDLNADPRVAFALMEMGGAPEALPPENVTAGIWTWEVPDYPSGPFANGNWGLKAIRAPQMWNLDTYVQRNHKTTNISAGVLDSGFDATHPDLGKLQVPAGTTVTDHGTMIAGIIGATWDNKRGVEGVDPWVTAIHGRKKVGGSLVEKFTRRLLQLINLSKDASIKAINNSYGLSRFYSDNGINTGWNFGELNGDNDNADPGEWASVDLNSDGSADSYSEVMDAYGSLYHFVLPSSSFYVSSAGNAGPGYIARDNNPINNAAIRFGGSFLAVEATGRSNAAAGFSTRSGSVSAPGDNVYSTDTSAARYGTGSGTSYAAPHVTGLITALYRLDPSLSTAQIRTLLTGNTFTVSTTGGTEPHIDALAAAMGIDLLRGNKELQRALVDVDDGTDDGNLRVNPASGASFTDIQTPDGRRGDGVIDMSDFRAFRDAYLQAMVEKGVLTAAQVSLDGAADHPKKDLNLDGCRGSGCTTDQNVFPRFDFNGDGQIAEWSETAPVKVDPDGGHTSNTTMEVLAIPGQARDIDVLADLWEMTIEQVSLNPADESLHTSNGQIWNPMHHLMEDRNGDGVPDYLYSVDFHIINPGGAAVWEVIIESALPVIDTFPDTSSEASFCLPDDLHDRAEYWHKCILDHASGDLVVTVPIDRGAFFPGVSHYVEFISLDQTPGRDPSDRLDQFLNFDSLQYGQDCYIDLTAKSVSCSAG